VNLPVILQCVKKPIEKERIQFYAETKEKKKKKKKNKPWDAATGFSATLLRPSTAAQAQRIL